MLLEFWFDVTQVWRRSSFKHWLMGVFLTLGAGLLLHALNASNSQVQPRPVAKSDACLQAAGSDLKHGELLARDASCTCTAAN